MGQIDYNRWHKYNIYKNILDRAYSKLRQDGFELKEPSDVYQIIDVFSDELSKLTPEQVQTKQPN